jgi:hypothetical protein
MENECYYDLDVLPEESGERVSFVQPDKIGKFGETKVEL